MKLLRSIFHIVVQIKHFLKCDQVITVHLIVQTCNLDLEYFLKFTACQKICSFKTVYFKQ